MTKKRRAKQKRKAPPPRHTYATRIREPLRLSTPPLCVRLRAAVRRTESRNVLVRGLRRTILRRTGPHRRLRREHTGRPSRFSGGGSRRTRNTKRGDIGCIYCFLACEPRKYSVYRYLSCTNTQGARDQFFSSPQVPW